MTARQRVGLASPFDVERARTQASSARAAIPPLETLAAVSRHRIAVLIGDQAANAAAVVPWTGVAIVPDVQPGQPASAARTPARPARIACTARSSELAASASGRGMVPAALPAGALRSSRPGSGQLRPRVGAVQQCRGSTDDADPQLGTDARINEIAESAQVEAVLHYEDQIVRALEDVENALVALKGERQREDALQNAAAAADAALGTRSRCTTADRSICCRCSMPSARVSPVRVERDREQHGSRAPRRSAVQGAWRRVGIL